MQQQHDCCFAGFPSRLHCKIVREFVLAYLSEQFDWWNGSGDVPLWQVEVVDEDDALLAHGRPEDALPAPVQLGHDDVLGVVDVGPGRKVDDVGDEPLLRQAPDERVGQERLAGAAGSNQT